MIYIRYLNGAMKLLSNDGVAAFRLRDVGPAYCVPGPMYVAYSLILYLKSVVKVAYATEVSIFIK